MSITDQPISIVEWIDPSSLHANDYNPNRVAPIERKLLKTSMIEDGWTQPIVARADGEIVDGFHRWDLAMNDPEVRALGDGRVPVVRLSPAKDAASQRMSTIRHNRARGSHYVVKMADIVTDLVDTYGLDRDDIERRLGMDEEEVERLYDHGAMTKRGSRETFGEAWRPAYTHETEGNGNDPQPAA